METYLTTSIEPIEVAFVRSGLDAALDVAAVKGVERGALALEDGGLRLGDPALADDALTAALVAVSTAAPMRWKVARTNAKWRAREAARALERRLVASGMLREATPWRWLTGRPTRRGAAWLAAARLAYPAAQVVATDPALALALHGARALDGTRYHAPTVAANAVATGDAGGCGASFAPASGGHGHGHGDGGSGGHGGHGDGGSGGDGGAGGCGGGGGGGCGGGGCGG